MKKALIEELEEQAFEMRRRSANQEISAKELELEAASKMKFAAKLLARAVQIDAEIAKLKASP